MLPAQGASIALFMLLAAMVTPQAPSGGVGLRTGLDPGTPAPAAMTLISSAPRAGGRPACDPRLDSEGRGTYKGAITLDATACAQGANARPAETAHRRAE